MMIVQCSSVRCKARKGVWGSGAKRQRWTMEAGARGEGGHLNFCSITCATFPSDLDPMVDIFHRALVNRQAGGAGRAECRGQIAECRVISAARRAQSAEGRGQSAEGRVQRAECRVQRAEGRVWSAECGVQGAEGRV